jgi:CubicO group peptidase (beta-lactamase class C family)
MKSFFLLLIWMPLVSAAQPAKPTTTQLDSLFRSYFKDTGPGGAVLIVQNGKTIYQKEFGVADMTTLGPITAKTLFNIGSISKTFVAYGILKLASQKKLALDDNLYTYFPDFKNRRIAKEVKVYHLLTHTSGIPDNRRVEEKHTFYLTAKDEENFAPLKQTDRLEFEPGTKYKYSNPAFNGLALIIEKVAQTKWQDYIRDTIFKPSGMNTSTITDGPHPETGVAHGYIEKKGGGFEELDYGEEPTFAAAGNGGVWSSTEELWKYEQAIQRHLFPAWSDVMPSRLGLSWFLTKETMGDMIGHTGSQGGFISDYLWLPEKKLFYVLLCNIPKPIKEIRSKVFAILP